MRRFEIDNILLDTVKPVMTEGADILIDGLANGGDYMTYTTAIPVTLSLSDTGAGIRGLPLPFYKRPG